MLLKMICIPAAIMIQAGLMSSHSFAWDFEDFKDRSCFDQHFQFYTNKYFGPHFNWHYFKAQAIAESRLSPEARSPKGAVGLMQILPSTFDDIVSKNRDIEGDIKDPRSNIAAGIFYNKTLWEGWSGDRSFQDRLNFTFASYNAGKSTILKAQKIAIEKGLNPYSWMSITKVLPVINKNKSLETIVYVNRIHKIRKVLQVKTTFQSKKTFLWRGTSLAVFQDQRHCSEL
jgi:membrane-bound lytic murein transglycosylase MltF